MVAWAAACVLLSGVLRGFTGFGFALAAVPLLTLQMLPSTAVPLVQILNLLIGFGRPSELRHNTDWRSLKWLIPGAVVATPAGALALVVLPPDAIRLAAGLAVAWATFLVYRRPSKPLPGTPGRTFALGAFAGLLNGSVALAGPPAVFHFLSLGLPAITMRASLIAFFFVTSLLGVVTVAVDGLVSPGMLFAAAALSLPLHLGNRLGAILFRHSNEIVYRRASLICLIATGVSAIGRALAGLLS